MTPVKLPLLLAAALLAPGAAGAVTDGERFAVYQEFRTAFDAHRYPEALPLAEKLVAMTQEQYGDSDRALINPLSDLGTTQYRLKDYKSAEDTFLKSVKIATGTGNGAAADRQLLRPLHGLGATYYATQQYEDASLTLQRALDLSRNLDGLENPGQLAILEPLIATLVSLERHSEVDREYQYEVRVAESAFGSNDLRVMRPLDSYAHWLEHIGRYPGARAQYARELTVAESAAGRTPILVIAPLRGIARSYRLEATNGAEDDAESSADPFASPGLGFVRQRDSHALNPDGERALTIALHTIDKIQPLDHRTRGLTLMELGDWYLCANQQDKALGQYRDAWKELTQSGSTEPLTAPRLLAYRAPAASASRSPLTERANTDEHTVEATFVVTRDGHTSGITTASSDATPSQQKIVLAAVKRARYAPRMENGEPVETQGVKLSEKLLSKRPRGT